MAAPLDRAGMGCHVTVGLWIPTQTMHSTLVSTWTAHRDCFQENTLFQKSSGRCTSTRRVQLWNHRMTASRRRWTSGVGVGRLTKGQNRGVGGHDAVKLLNDEGVELTKVTPPSPGLTRLGYNR